MSRYDSTPIGQLEVFLQINQNRDKVLAIGYVIIQEFVGSKFVGSKVGSKLAIGYVFMKLIMKKTVDSAKCTATVCTHNTCHGYSTMSYDI